MAESTAGPCSRASMGARSNARTSQSYCCASPGAAAPHAAARRTSLGDVERHFLDRRRAAVVEPSKRQRAGTRHLQKERDVGIGGDARAESGGENLLALEARCERVDDVVGNDLARAILAVPGL